jgi:hypothetical protein
MSYLSNFYNTALTHASEDAYGAAYKGFNDSLASWGTGRFMSQQCGQTWLQTFSKINGMYNSSRQLDALQLVTWNDYEEGTEIESGIDNCLSISASISGGTLQWSVHGNEDTVDHYTVFVSQDGQNLMDLTQTSAGNHSINLGSYSLSPGNYSIYVQAVGKPVFRNHMSAAVHYAAGGIALATSPSSLTLGAGESATLQVAVTAVATDVSAPIALACSNLPAGARCAFSPSSVTPGTGTATATLTISAGRLTAAAPQRGPLYGLYLSTFGLTGMFLMRGEKLRKGVLAGVIGVLLLVLCSCGIAPTTAMPSSASQTVAQGTYAVTVSGTSSSVRSSTTLTLHIH